MRSVRALPPIKFVDSCGRMFHSLANIGGANKWRMVLAGTPTYFAAVMLSLRYPESSTIGSFLVFVSFVVIYDYAYQFLFSRFESSKKTGKLIVFFVAQLAFWVVVFFLWFDIRKQMGL